jgi:hypothetical protein
MCLYECVCVCVRLLTLIPYENSFSSRAFCVVVCIFEELTNLQHHWCFSGPAAPLGGCYLCMRKKIILVRVCLTQWIHIANAPKIM